ncbi:MAG: 30S ribosomal protein S8 [Patescibacteria group bacterium]
MYTDPISDMLTRIRNAIMAHHENVSIPHSQVKESILKVIKENGFIESFKVEDYETGKVLEVTLKDHVSKLTLKRVSKPGQRIYIKKADIRPVVSDLGIAIISTSQGIMTTKEAKKKNLGGELICELY